MKKQKIKKGELKVGMRVHGTTRSPKAAFEGKIDSIERNGVWAMVDGKFLTGEELWCWNVSLRSDDYWGADCVHGFLYKGKHPQKARKK